MLPMFFALAHAADPLSSWQGSRWLLEIEETTPSPLELSAEENRTFQTRAFQFRAVLDCPRVTPLGKKAAEVDCDWVALALRATPRTTDTPAAVWDTNRLVLEDVERRLKESTVRITVGTDGRVTTVDLPGLKANNRRESESRENLRRVVYDLIAGFHLKRPDDWQAGWTEKGSALLRAPTQPASTGSTRIDHQVQTVDGATVIQSSGEGTFTSPYVPWEFGYAGRTGSTRGASGGVSGGASGGIGSTSPMSATPTQDGRMVSTGPQASASTPTDRIFTGELTSVAVVDANGHPVERVWAMLGQATASSVGNMMGASIWYAGHLRALSPGETPDIGVTALVGPPGVEVAGLDPWVPLETF